MDIFQIVYDFVVSNQGLSYFIVFLVAVLEAIIFVGLFIPAGILIAILGFIAHGGHISSWFIILIIVVGAVLGDIISFILGKTHAKKHKLKNLEKIDSVFKKRNYLKEGELFFEKHGGKSVLIGRFVGFVRPFIAFVAGTMNMSFSRFMMFNFIGAVLWTLLYFYIGYIFGSSAEIIVSWVKKAGEAVFVLLFLVVLFLYIRSIFNKKYKDIFLKKINSFFKTDNNN